MRRRAWVMAGVATLVWLGLAALPVLAQQAEPSAAAAQPRVASLLAILLFEIPVMFGFPLALGWYIKRRFGVGWAAFGWGALTFVLSQVVHIPLNVALGLAGGGRGVALWPIVPLALVAGLSAGVCEEGARWLVLRFVARKVRGWRAGLQFGAGHGGIESIITGVLVLLGLINVLVSGAMDLAAAGMTPEVVEQVRVAQVHYWGTPAYMFLIGGLERVLAITVHIALASLVMRAVVRSRVLYLIAAVLLHTALDFWAVWGARAVGAIGVEAGLVVFALFSVWVIWRLREEVPAEVGPAAVGDVAPGAASLTPRELSAEELARRIDSSRYE